MMESRTLMARVLHGSCQSGTSRPSKHEHDAPVFRFLDLLSTSLSFSSLILRRMLSASASPLILSALAARLAIPLWTSQITC